MVFPAQGGRITSIGGMNRTVPVSFRRFGKSKRKSSKRKSSKRKSSKRKYSKRRSYKINH